MKELFSYIAKQREDWKGLREAEKQYPNSFFLFLENLADAVMHWVISVLFVVGVNACGRLEGLWTAVDRAEFLRVLCYCIVVAAICHYTFAFFNQKRSMPRLSGYAAGLVVGFVIVIAQMEGLIQLETKTIIRIFVELISIKCWCKGFVFMMGPMQQDDKKTR